MNILFFQWRYHTNRHPMVKAFINGGHKVKYISQYKKPDIENYKLLYPDIIGYSTTFSLITKILNKDNSRIRKRYGWPPLRNIYKEMESFDPDIIIVRDYDFVSAIILAVGKLFGANGIVQEQVPKYRDKISWKKDFGHKIHQQVFDYPLLCVTPIKGNTNKKTREYIYYVPFPVDLDVYRPLNVPIDEKEDKISIISIGKLRQKRKNHMDLLKAINDLTNEYNIHLTLVGHLENENNENYRRIVKYIDKSGLNNRVSIKTNMEHDELQSEYKNHDLFVLPSEDEPAAVSPLEAMAAGLPVITSDSNGTNCYIDDGKNGLIFKTGSVADLKMKMQEIIQNKNNMKLMGQRSLEIVNENHTPQKYLKRMENVIEENFA